MSGAWGRRSADVAPRKAEEEEERRRRDEEAVEEEEDDLEGLDEESEEEEEEIDEEITDDMLDLPPEPVLEVDRNIDTILFVDNLPVVGPERREKLVKVVTKVFTALQGIKLGKGGVRMPAKDSGESLGFAFVEYATPQMAAAAARHTNGHALDKKHTLKVMLFSEFRRIMDVKEEYKPLEKKEYEARENMLWYLTDSRGREQYVIRYQDETEVLWNDPLLGSESIYQRRNWTEEGVQWSPLGTYLVTFHRPGVVLWGGPTWGKLMRFNHPGVKAIEFSPKENFLITFNNTDPAHDDPKDPRSIIVWDVRTGRKLRSFMGNSRPEEPPEGEQPRKPRGFEKVWPVFKWSHDDKYLARHVAKGISVYKTPDMGLLDKKTILLDGVHDFSWSPTDNILSYWVPEQGAVPARVCLMRVPEREVLQQKNLFNVVDCRLHWQSEGRFLCVKVDRHTKTKKSFFSSFEVFRVKVKNIPTEILDLKDTVVAFAWEPKGDRFAIIHGDAIALSNKLADVSFYQVGEKETKRTMHLPKKSVNTLFWSPQGRFLLLAALRQHSGVLEFWLPEDGEMLGEGEHFMCTDVEWDPTGRYVTTSVSYFRQQMENGYNVWSFAGQPLHQFSKERFFQILWRPRPPTLLSPEEEKKARKSVKTFTKEFTEIDDAIRSDLQAGHARERRELREQFSKFLISRSSWAQDNRRKRRQQRGGVDSDTEDLVEMEVEDETVLEEDIENVEL